ncbi:MAG: DNA helicase RecQ [Actinobacteria bacterium]|nr:DNA helicase RecQ [Actinomycetota bacterium]
MRTLLKTYFGYDKFRPLQEEIVASVLAKRDCLVLMPTGGGKSLCYQLPALKFDGLTLVVSPLISLMKDQVDALQANGVAADFINSSLTQTEINRAMVRVRQERTKILYLAPERVAVPDFQAFLSALKVSLIAIDEAHCISEWGHDFRPEYRNLKTLRRDFPDAPVIALTATATRRVREDIIAQLELKEAQTFISSFNRPNLTYLVRPKRNAFNALLALLHKHQNEPTIIYCVSRKGTEELAADLRANNFNAMAYHAGLANDVRKETQEKFIRDEVPIVVATIAFGMGIDKPDVRLIVHYDMPRTLEGYYQETGRAGRDGLPSECVLFYSYGDKIKHDFFIDQIEDPSERNRAGDKLAQVIEYCEWQDCRRAYLLKYFGEEWERQDCGGCDVCLTPRAEFDATEIAQKILSAVVRTGERFGAGYVINVLRGANDKKIRERGHEGLSVFGIVQDFTIDELVQLINVLLARKLLVKNGHRYPTLGLTEAGRSWLKLRERIILPRPARGVEQRAAKTAGEIDFDRELFEKLRVLRKTLADERGVPPFVIFGDASLQEMAAYFPQRPESLSEIFGVGAEKLAHFGEAFLAVIRRHTLELGLEEQVAPARRPAKNRTVNRSGATYDETKKLVLQKLSLAEIAERRGLAEETIISHLERLVEFGAELDLDYLKPPPERLVEIKAAFEQSGGHFLTPVRAILGQEFSFAELRLVRLFLADS